MAINTDAERAEFEAWARDQYPSIDLTRDGDGYSKFMAKDYWSLWQAARRTQAAPAPAQEPFGYFKRDTYGWMDCSKDTKGAVALYAAPQPQADAGDAGRYLDYLINNQALVLNNLDEYEGDEDDVDCGYWLERTDDKSQALVQRGIFKTPRDAIEAAIAAAEKMK